MDHSRATVSMTAIAPHRHVDEAGHEVTHQPGDVYTITSYGGMTVDDLASSLTALGFARRTEAAKTTATASPALEKPIQKPPPIKKSTHDSDRKQE